MEIQRLRDYGIKELRNERFQVSGVGCKKLHSAESRAQSVHAISFLYAPCSMLSALCYISMPKKLAMRKASLFLNTE